MADNTGNNIIRTEDTAEYKAIGSSRGDARGGTRDHPINGSGDDAIGGCGDHPINGSGINPFSRTDADSPGSGAGAGDLLGGISSEQLMSYILDAFPFPIVFADCNHIIRYMNKRAKYHYYEERGYRDLIGRSLLDCHSLESQEKIKALVSRLARNSPEIFIRVTDRNERLYIVPVRNSDGRLIGYFERFELNCVK